jgi:hypothetical protein
MIRLPALCLAGCVVCAGLILSNDSASLEARLPPAKTDPTAPQIRKLVDPPSSPIQPHAEVLSSVDDADSPLRDVRLTGVVIGSDLRVAIFAVTGTNPRVLSEGETLKGWRLDSISPEKVSLSSPAGTITLEPKPDANLVRTPPPVAVRPGALEPSLPQGMALAGVPEQPSAMTPIPIGNLSAAFQPEGYPYYFPEYYAGYEQDYPSYNYPYPYPYFAYAVPARVGFRSGFFHRHDIHQRCLPQRWVPRRWILRRRPLSGGPPILNISGQPRRCTGRRARKGVVRKC